MRITAILSIRNEAEYIGNCLAHLVHNGLDFIVIDNESDDRTVDIVRQDRFARHLVDLRSHPYPGYFDWQGLMQAREKAASECGADWVLFVSADEIMHSRREAETLSDAIHRIADTGAQVIDFEEFVFLPVDTDYVSDAEGWQPLRHYYFFQPAPVRLMRARRTDLDVSHIEMGGHTLVGSPYRLADEKMVLRHYIFRSRQHAEQKYTQRVFAESEVKRGWHGNRIGFHDSAFSFPSAERLKLLRQTDQRDLERDQPVLKHYWEW